MVSYTEYTDSQLPAIKLLRKMGYTYISPEEAVRKREYILSNVILEDILAERLAAINSFEYKGETYPFSQGNIQAAINALKNIPDEGLAQTNEKVYDLLTLGKSFTETIQGDRKSYTIRYIDWEQPENNVYHITDEFVVEGLKEIRRPNIVLFVNGIPFVVIENKRRDKNESIRDSISQHLRNQRKDEGIPRLFQYVQLMLAVQPNEVKYGTVNTAEKFWSVWKEENKKEVSGLIAKSLNGIEAGDRLDTMQDGSLFALCRPERLMELSYKFIVFDSGEKKITRYQQYFAIQDTLQRVKEINKDGSRKGGVIWHTQGSGKSLTMVMLSKCLTLDKEIPNSRVIIVTDRVSLDKQIYKTFLNCGKAVHKAKSGNNLIELIQDKGIETITTIIDKFETALNRKDFSDPSENLFVLVDESHRSQYGGTHSKMKRMLPGACYLGFTGTPLMKKEKSTARRFGGFIHCYTIDNAVKDGAVLPLLYEGRSAKLSINKVQIDKGFDRLTAPLNEEAQKDLKKKFARISRIYESQQVLEEIAYDISAHYCKNWKGTGFKAQLAVPKIDTAVRYQKYFEEQTNPDLKINTAVIFTPPDNREGYFDVYEDPREEGRKYWKKITEKYGNQETYEEHVIANFKESSDEFEIIIVVSKLLTGFDAPRNTVLYLAKPLQSHNLLQAIARVNRLFENKEFGHIIDYVGLLGKLDEALTQYGAFEGYEEEDLKNAVTDIREEIRKVPARHADVWDVFKEVYNKKDIEALERHLLPKDIRDSFYTKLTAFARTLHTALSSDEFYEEFHDSQIEFYKNELRNFEKLRRSVQARYAEIVSYAEYEPKVRKLLDTYIQAESVDILSREVNIFDKDMVQEVLQNYGKTPASKADMIAHQMKKVITENMEKDEAFYRKFSEMIEAIIKAFNEDRLNEKEYLEKIIKVREDLANGYQNGIPEILKNNEEARAFYGAVKAVLESRIDKNNLAKHETQLALAGLDIYEIVRKLIIRDWKKNLDIHRKIENSIEDYLIEKRKSFGSELSFDDIDDLLVKCLKVAKHNF